MSFPEWQEVLDASALPPAIREQHRRAIFTFLKLCKTRRAPASVALVRQHLADAATATGAQEALRWFFREGRNRERQVAGQLKAEGDVEAAGRARAVGDNRPYLSDSTSSRPSGRSGNRGDQGALTDSAVTGHLASESRHKAAPTVRQVQSVHPTSEEKTDGAHSSAGPRNALPLEPSKRRSSVPSLAASDLGGADWERDLIKATREAGMLWRTEETYRGWAARFARFIAPRSPYAAGAKDVGDFLSALAVEQRVAPSTQKQAA